MSDDDLEETEERRLFSPFYIMRKIFFILAVIFVLWTYANQSLNPARHTAPTQAIEKKPARETAAEPNSLAAAPPAPTVQAESATPTNHNDDIDHLRGQVAALEARSENSTAAADKEKVAQLEQQLAEQAKAVQELKAQINDIQAVRTQMGDMATQSNRKLSALTALGMVKESLHNGEAFTTSLNQLYTLVPADAKNSAATVELLNKLKPYSDKGVPTWPSLQSQFEQLLPLALTPDQEDSWQKNLQSLIRIRKVGEQQQGGDDEAILARAEAKLANHDMSATLKELEALSKPAAAVLEPWIANARAMQNANSTVDALQIAFVADND